MLTCVNRLVFNNLNIYFWSMNDRKYRYTLYIITIVILSTIAIQGYWNYKNYIFNKQQLIKDIQISLDKAVDDYYTELAQKTTLGFKIEGDAQKNVLDDGGFFDSVAANIDKSNSKFKDFRALKIDSVKGITVFRGFKADSLMNEKDEKGKHFIKNDDKGISKWLKKENDSNSAKNFGLLTSKVLISITNDTLDVKQVDSILFTDLTRKNISIDYFLDFKEAEKRFPSIIKSIKEKEPKIDPNLLNVKSKSTFLPKNSSLTIYFENINWTVFKRIFSAFFISAFLVLAVVACLFYLLEIIKKQKQLAEVKNDLISNITHEFKTPIATIGVAIESIKNFNVIDDKEKTKSYLDVSNTQLNKLNIMVEKLLETATLDSDSLDLNKEEIDVSILLHSLVNKHKLQTETKIINVNLPPESIIVSVDFFHFENAINNILDNAVKYGGDVINVNLSQNKTSFNISISDNGNSLKKVNKEKIFEKFYRVPKGNTHDVKGFGIGLYYTKKIIEKHNGSIELDLTKNMTNFKISLPNE